MDIKDPTWKDTLTKEEAEELKGAEDEGFSKPLPEALKELLFLLNGKVIDCLQHYINSSS